MTLRDIIERPVSELTEEELEQRLALLKKLKYVEEKPEKPSGNSKTPGTGKAIKTNRDRRIEDLLGQLSSQELEELKKLISNTKED